MLQPDSVFLSPNDSELGFANDAFYFSLNRLLQGDRHLREAIKSVRAGGIDGQTLILDANPDRLETVYKKLLKVVQLIVLLGAAYQFIDINGDKIAISSLLLLQPKISNVREGRYDKRRSMEQVTQLAQRYRALLGYATNKATVFVISTTGIYKDVHIRQGVTSKIPPEEMINRPLDEVLPSLETALYIVQQIKEAYRIGEPRRITYGLWEHRYEAEIIPIPEAEEVVLVCNRTEST